MAPPEYIRQCHVAREIIHQSSHVRVDAQSGYANAGKHEVEAPTYLESWVSGAVDGCLEIRQRDGVFETLGDIAACLTPVGLSPARFFLGILTSYSLHHRKQFSAGFKQNHGGRGGILLGSQ